VWDTISGEMLDMLEVLGSDHRHPIESISMAADGSVIALALTGAYSDRVHVWQLGAGTSLGSARSLSEFAERPFVDRDGLYDGDRERETLRRRVPKYWCDSCDERANRLKICSMVDDHCGDDSMFESCGKELCENCAHVCDDCNQYYCDEHRRYMSQCPAYR
jgi:hypothetical protein